jgi:hypothetical protein
MYGPDRLVGIPTGNEQDNPGIDSGGARFSAPVQTGPGAHSASCTMGTGSFPGVKSDRGLNLTPHPLIMPSSRNSRAIPLLPLWAVRPVQSLSACIRVTFNFYLQANVDYREVQYMQCVQTLWDPIMYVHTACTFR